MSVAVPRNEAFCPMASLLRFKSDDEVIRMANVTKYDLTAYFKLPQPVPSVANSRLLGVRALMIYWRSSTSVVGVSWRFLSGLQYEFI